MHFHAPTCAPQSSDEDLEEFEVELFKHGGRSLGITIAGLAVADTGGRLLICTCNRYRMEGNFCGAKYSQIDIIKKIRG